MKSLVLASLWAALAVATAGQARLQSAPAPQPQGAAQPDPEQDERWRRLQAENAAAQAQRREAQERYERALRDTEASRAQYEAEMARHRAEVEAAERRQAEYEARMEAYRNQAAARAAGRREPPEQDQPAERRERSGNIERREQTDEGERRQETAQSSPSCERQSRRNRRRGRLLGTVVGTAATALGAGDGLGAAAVGLVPIGALLGEAIAGMLDCDEQQKAADATEEAVEQAERGGVGSSSSWESETRPGVRGSSTVTAIETASADGMCMTVTDIVIVDGEETRAPKRMCRRPPSNRYVRV